MSSASTSTEPNKETSTPQDDPAKRTVSKHEHDVEGQPIHPPRVSHLKLVFDQSLVTEHVLNHKFNGSGTEEDPFVVEYIPHDPRNPMTFGMAKKWTITLLVAFVTLAVAFVSSAYSGGVIQIMEDFHCSEEVAILGISLYVLGFAIGPLFWAPMSEMYGRQVILFISYGFFTAFNAGAAGSQNIWTLVILRFFAGAFGSSPLTNAGGVIADMFAAEQRGLALSVFASAPFLGPSIGPIVGDFVGETVGWRWVEGVMAIFTGFLWILGTLTVPETYSPLILRRRAEKLSKITGKVYKSKAEITQGKKTLTKEIKTALSRPWVLLLFEPIVLLLSIYMAVVYGTLYLCFAAFPIVYEQGKGWSQGIGGLAFLGVTVGMTLAIAATIPDNKRYVKAARKAGGMAPPEARLPPCMVGCILLPIGLFWFAWTNGPDTPWPASLVGSAPFGFGMVLVFLSIFNYLIDAYTIYAASVLAANSLLRSLFGAIFPLFTTYMYDNLGVHWASSIPAFLALACVPFPFLFYKYGPAIRKRCKFAAQSQLFVENLRKDLARIRQEEAEEDAEEEEKEEELRHPHNHETDVEKGESSGQQAQGHAEPLGDFEENRERDAEVSEEKEDKKKEEL